MATEDTPDPMAMAKEMGEAFQEMDLGGMTMYGRSGFFVLYEWDSDDPTTPFDVALHHALDELLEDLWIDADIVAEAHGEVTPETIATETTEQIHELTGVRLNEWARERFEATLADHLQNLNETGGEA